MDRNPERARDVCGDFTRLPFRTGAADLVIFDPPYITNPSKAGHPPDGRPLGAYPSLQAMQASVETGCREAWRVARLGCWSRCRIKSGGALGRDDRGVRQAIGQPPYQRIDAIRSAPKIRRAN